MKLYLTGDNNPNNNITSNNRNPLTKPTIEPSNNNDAKDTIIIKVLLGLLLNLLVKHGLGRLQRPLATTNLYDFECYISTDLLP